MTHRLFRTILAGLLPAAVLLMTAACSGSSDSKLQEQVDSLLTLTARQQGDIANMEQFVAVLSEGLDTIAKQEGMLFYTNQGPEGTIVDRNQLKRNLDMFANTLNEQRQRIQQLTDSLRSKGMAVGKLQSLVNYLNTQIDEKDRMISHLRSELDQKNIDINQLRSQVAALSHDNSQLNQQVQEGQRQARERDAADNAGYVVIGSSKTLKEYGIISGGGLRRVTINYDNLPTELFTQVDIRSFGGLEIPSAKAKLLSGNPSYSYEIVRTDQSQSELHILDPDAFWSGSHYVVIQTK